MTIDDLRKSIDDFVDSVDLSKVDINKIDLKKVDLDYSNIENDIKNAKSSGSFSDDEKKELEDRFNFITELKDKLKVFKDTADKIKIANHNIDQTKDMIKSNPSLASSLNSVVTDLEKKRDALNTVLGAATVGYNTAINNYDAAYSTRKVVVPPPKPTPVPPKPAQCPLSRPNLVSR